MKFIPKPNQVELIRHGLENPINLWMVEMGLSKTAARLEIWNTLFTNGELKGVLVVAPLYVATMTWANEVEKWDDFRWMRVANLRTKEGIEAWHNQGAEIYCINYEMLGKFADKHIRGMPRNRLPVNEVHFDEIDNAKSPSSKRINQFRAATRRKGRDGKTERLFPRWTGQTGTPIGTNRIGLFAQVRLLDDGQRWGTGYTRWRDQHFRPENYRSDFPKWVLLPGMEGKLEQDIADFTIVQTSKEWGDWETPTYKEIPVEIPENVRKQYKQLEREYLAELDDGWEVIANFEGVMPNKLLQMCSGNIYVRDSEDAERQVVRLHDEKIKALKKLQKDLQGQPLLIATAYQHEKQVILQEIEGAVEFSKHIMPKWNRGEIPAMVAHPKSIGHGLNLQEGGSNVVWFTRPWNPDLFDQFNARLARRGQTEKVTVWSIICQDSIDVVLTENLRAKQADQSKFKENLKKLRKN